MRLIDQGFVGNISQEDLDEKGKRKLHHYVPIWFQRGFTDDDGLLWTADKNHDEPQRISPKMLFAKNQLNQVRDPDTSDGHPRVMLDGEDAFAELDGVFSRTVRSVLERTAAAARCTTVDMDRETRQCLQQFVVMQFLRNHGKWMQKYVAAGEPKHLVKAATIGAVLGLHNEPDPGTTGILDSCCLQMAIAPGKGTLIFGNEPVCLTVHDYYNNKTRPQAGHGVVGIPLDRRTFVLWSRSVVHRRDKAPLLTLSTRGLKDINRTILEQSNRIAGPDRHVIHALLKAHRARHRVGVVTPCGPLGRLRGRNMDARPCMWRRRSARRRMSLRPWSVLGPSPTRDWKMEARPASRGTVQRDAWHRYGPRRGRG